MDRICTECGREASRLRKERCNACYMRLYRRGELPDGARCGACGERRQKLLTNTPIGVLCGNCNLVYLRTRPVPSSLAELVTHTRREVWTRAPQAATAPRRSARPSRPSFDPAVD